MNWKTWQKCSCDYPREQPTPVAPARALSSTCGGNQPARSTAVYQIRPARERTALDDKSTMEPIR